jgi:hypothetical protein
MCKDLIFFGGGGGGSVNTGVLQIAGGVPLDSTLRFVEDQNGTDSAIQLSTLGLRVDDGSNSIADFRSAQIQMYRTIEVGAGSVTNNAFANFKSAGGNIASFRDSANVEVSSISNGGLVSALGISVLSNNTLFDTTTNFISNYNAGGTALKVRGNGGTAKGLQVLFNNAGNTNNLQEWLATDEVTVLASISYQGKMFAEDFTSANLSTGTLTTARPMQFGDKDTVTTGNDLGLDAQIAVEHNGNVYYIPCKTSLIT